MICISLGSGNIQEIDVICRNHDLVELRLDLLNLELNYVDHLLNNHTNIIVTYRLNCNNYDLDYAITVYRKALLSNVSYIDIDLNDYTTIHIHLENELAKSSTKLILSYHNHDYTPDSSNLNTIFYKMQSFNADISKLCFKANNISDVIRTMELYKNAKTNKLIAFNLGDIGSLSRILAIQKGAPFMYASTENNKTEPSQLSFDELSRIMELLQI